MWIGPLQSVALAAVFGFSGARAAWGQLSITGAAPGNYSSRVTGLSADGQVAAGYSQLRAGAGINPGFTWTAGTGRVDFGLLPGMPSLTWANGISGDGHWIVGTTADAALNHFRPFIYRPDTGLRTLGTIAGYSESEGRGISNNGTVVVGNSHDPDEFAAIAWRWTDAGGMQTLGWTRPSHFYSDATAVSRNGDATVGYSYDGFTQDAFVWTEEEGMKALHGPGGARAQAFGVNDTGSIVVGSFHFSDTSDHATLWQGGSVLDLGLATGTRRSYATSVSDDGSVVVGHAEPDSGSVLSTAYIWTVSEGASTLDAYVIAQGISMPAGWRFFDANSISADGRIIGGRGGFGNGVSLGFVLEIPSPGFLGVLSTVVLARCRRPRSR